MIVCISSKPTHTHTHITDARTLDANMKMYKNLHTWSQASEATSKTQISAHSFNWGWTTAVVHFKQTSTALYNHLHKWTKPIQRRPESNISPPHPLDPRLQRTKLGLTQTPNKSQSKWTLSQDNNYDHYHDHFTILTNWQAYMQHVVTDGRNDIGFIIQKSLCQKLLTSNEWCWGSGGGEKGELMEGPQSEHKWINEHDVLSGQTTWNYEILPEDKGIQVPVLYCFLVVVLLFS